MRMKRSRLTAVLLLIIAVAFVVRCLPSLIFRPFWTEYVVVAALTAAALLFSVKKLKGLTFHWIDVFWLTTPWMLFTGTIYIKYAFYVVISIICYFLVQMDDDSIGAIRYPYFVFAMITALVTWLSFFNPSYYISHILSMFPEGKGLTSSFLHGNMYHGFTNHYSRNALYLIIAMMMLFCLTVTRKKYNKRIVYPLIVFFLATILLVAKRGPTIAMLVSMLVLLVLKEKSLIKKIRKSLNYILIGTALILVLYVAVPGVRNMVTRIVTPNSKGDFTSGRLYLWAIAWKMFLKKPFLGNGWGSFLKAMTGTTFQGVHNDYLQYLAETGIVGFVFFLIRDIGTLTLTVFAFVNNQSPKLQGTAVQFWMSLSLLFQLFLLSYSMTGLPHFSYEQYGLYTILCGYAVGQMKKTKARARAKKRAMERKSLIELGRAE